jgi:hypothetical protein
VQIDYKQLAIALVEAQLLLADKERERQVLETEEEKRKRFEALGKKDFSSEKRWIVRKIKELINSISVIFHILFIKRSDAQYLSGTNVLFRGMTLMIFGGAKLGLYALAIYLIVQGIINKEYATYGIWAVAAVLYAQIFRITQFEIERIKDQEYLVAIFATIISVVSLVVSIFLR